MSLYFDLAIITSLDAKVPKSFIDVIHYLFNPEFNLETTPELLYEDSDFWPLFEGHHFLAHDPARDVISSFRRISLVDQQVEIIYYTIQFAGRHIHDDTFLFKHMPFLYWLATFAEEGFIGYMKEKYTQPKLLYVKDRKLRILAHETPWSENLS